MICERYREAMSARLDGEVTRVEAAAIEAHVAVCSSCRAFASQMARVTRATRVTAAESVPDLTGQIMATLDTRREFVRARPAAARTAAPSSTGIARLGLALVALAQLALAVPGLLGDDGGAPVHIAREQGSWALALAVALLVVAWHPARAAGILVLVGVLVAGLTATMAVDIIGGRTVAATEAPHFLALLGFGLLWLVAHPGAGARRPIGRRAAPA
jgi:predicted anti-sigma-YlaC factor YlaD